MLVHLRAFSCGLLHLVKKARMSRIVRHFSGVPSSLPLCTHLLRRCPRCLVLLSPCRREFLSASISPLPPSLFLLSCLSLTLFLAEGEGEGRLAQGSPHGSHLDTTSLGKTKVVCKISGNKENNIYPKKVAGENANMRRILLIFAPEGDGGGRKEEGGELLRP